MGRKIEILGKQTFCDLAEKIIETMNWQDDHMHGFYLGKFYGSPGMYAPFWEDDPHPTFKTNQVKIIDIDYEKQPFLNFIFDFGDSHMFKVKLEETLELESKKRINNFPKLIDERGVAPKQYPPYEQEE